jgi:hypothetical protein
MYLPRISRISIKLKPADLQMPSAGSPIGQARN